MIALLALCALLALPIMSVLFSLLVGGPEQVSALFSGRLLEYAFNTLSLMGLVALFAGLFGVGAAWCVATMQFPGRNILKWALILPLAAPPYIIAYLYTDLLGTLGPVQTWLKALWSLEVSADLFPHLRTVPFAALLISLVLYPYIYMLALVSFSGEGGSQFSAARTLGLNPFQAFFRVALPNARPAIAAGSALVLMETLADFGVADYFAIPTLSVAVYRTWLGQGDLELAKSLASVMLLFVFLLVWLEAAGRKQQQSKNTHIQTGDVLFVLSGFRGLAALVFCLLPLTLGFLLPTLALAIYALNNLGGETLAQLVSYASNSSLAAIFTVVATTMIGVCLVYANRLLAKTDASRRLMKGALRFATLGYALPGTVLAVGLISVLGPFDIWLTGLSRSITGLSHGLLLSGSLFLLVFALTIRFLTIAFNGAQAGMDKISTNMDHSAQVLGEKPLGLLKRIHIPLIRPNLVVAACLVSVDVIRELPATLILRPFNFETLATRVYRLASDERLAEASVAALMIILLGLIPILVFQVRKV